MPKAERAVDWEAIEPEWRAGILSKKQLSEKYKVSRAAIDKHFGKLGIDRDLTEKIRQEAEAKVTRDAVAHQVTQERLRVTEREIVEANATMQADVIRSHRRDIQRHRALVAKLLEQLEVETGETDAFREIGVLLAAPNDKGVDKINEAYHKAISLPSRIDGAKKLAETLKVLLGLERQAFGLADNAEGDKPPEAPAETTSMLDAARRIAFTLAQGAAAAKKAKSS